MILQDFHVHTTFSDGRASPEEMARAAIERGLVRLGFSDHAHTPGGESYCMAAGREEEYCQRINALKERYKGKLEIYCGIEQDLYSDLPTERYDYVIGSVHDFYFDGKVYDVDYSADMSREIIDRFFGGDPLAMAEAYFGMVARLADMRPHIVGHIDLITKFNESGEMFDTSHPRYLAAAYGAVDALLPTGAYFEINTGAISRGYRKTPYPGPELLRYILKKGGRVLLSGDAHSPEGIGYCFAEAEAYFKDILSKI